MALKWNTSQLLAAPAQDNGERTPVEYHFQSWRELYDKSIITADRYSSSAGEWVLRGDFHFYTLKVITRPTYALPQELCLSFDCFSRKDLKELSGGSSFVSLGPPIEPVASQFATLLSTLAREPIVPLGPRRIGNQLVEAREIEQAERQRMFGVISSLTEDARKDLLTLTQWTARFLGLSVINPMTSNRV